MTKRASHRAAGALALALACLLGASTAPVAGAAPGALDLGFSGDGLLTSDFGRGDSRAAAVVLQPDGKIVTVGDRADRFTGPGSVPDFALARYDADGSLDETFSGDGLQTTSFTLDVDQATAVALQPADGKIVVAGRAGGDDGNFAVARYKTDGSLDESFSGDGLQTIDFGTYSEAAGVAVQADGAIVVAGTAGVGLSSDFALARLEPDGDPDASFGDAGIVTTDVDTSDRAAALTLQPDGLIVVAGSAAASTGFTTDDNLFAVARYETDGDLDPGFGDGGIRTAVVNSPHGGWAAAVALDGDGRIVVAGATALSEIAVVRLDAGGDLDATFSGDGLALTAGSLGVGIAIGPGDTITVLARAGTFSGTTLARYDASGAPDASIGAGGTRRFDEIATPAGVALQPDGRIVATGSAGYYAASHDFVVARRNADGSPDASFAGDGAQTTEFAGAGADEAAALAIGSDGSIVAAGSSDDDEGFETTGTGDLVLARYAADGAPRPTFSGDGVVTDDRVQGASAVALQPDGRIVAAGRSGGDLAVVRYNADGTRDAGFGSAGIRLTDFGSGGDRASALTLAAGGKIVVAGSGGSDPMAAAGDFALARYDAGGAPDASFSGDGRVLADSGGIDSAKAVAIDGDGRIVIAGSEANVNGTDSNIAVLRFNADGSPDPSFSGDGRQTIDFGGIDRGAALALQPDDRIVVAGTARAGGDSDVAVARLNIDGSPDTSFSGDGKQTTDFGGGADGGAGVVVTAGGAIVVAGVAGGGETDFALVRYDAGGTPDGTFSGDGVTLTDFAGSDDRALALAAGPGETIVAAGGATITSSPDFALARYDNDEAEVIVDPPPAPPPPPAAAPPPAATPPPAAAPPAAAPPAVTPPLPPAAPADRRAPAATLSARAAQRLRPTIAIGLTCPQEACVAKVTATVRIAGGGATPAVTRALRRVTRSLARGSKMRLELRLPSALRTTIRRALLRRRPVTVAVRSTVSDAAGNARVVKLARPIRLAL